MNAVLEVLVWIPIMVSAVLIGTSWMAYWTVGAGSPRSLAFLTAWFVVATYLQLFATTPALTTTGLVLQAALAVTLIMRVKFQSGGA